MVALDLRPRVRWSLLALLAIGLAAVPPARAQVEIFESLHQMLPPDAYPTRAVVLADLDGDGALDLVIGNCGVRDRLDLNDGAGRFTDATDRLPVPPGWWSIVTISLAVGDVDGDGDLDLFHGQIDFGQGDRLSLNDGTGRFTDGSTQLPQLGDHEPNASAFGDVDGDGDLDLVLGNYKQDMLLLNDGTGRFTPTSRLPPDHDATYALALGDVDGDGDLDIVAGNDGQSQLSINDGTGHFTLASGWLPVHSDRTHALVLTDLDADGDLDLVLGNDYNQSLLYLNDGTGHYSDATAQLPQHKDQTMALAVADVDQDGDPDLILGNQNQQSRLYQNDGSGRFDEATDHLPQAALGTNALALGDVDGDGDQDVIVGNSYSTYGSYGQEDLYLNDGTGRFTDVTAQMPPDGDFTLDIAHGDVDGDGDEDLVLGNFLSSTRLALNDGAGHFTDATDHLPKNGKQAVSSVILGDVDGDGDLDLLRVRGYTSADLYLNDGTGHFTIGTGQVPWSNHDLSALVLGDVDGDHDLDIVAADYDGQARLYLNDGTGHFTDATWKLPQAELYTTALVLGDVDGDGDLDLVLGNGDAYCYYGCGDNQDRLYLNDGDGNFTDHTRQLPVDDRVPAKLLLGDIDGDGDLDLLVSNGYPCPEPLRLYLNNGKGSFHEVKGHLPREMGITTAFTLGDVDGDGDPDLVWRWASMGEATAGALIDLQGCNRVALNDGRGRFERVGVQLPIEQDLVNVLALADIDGDGDLDLLVGNGNQNRIVTNVTHQLAWRAVPRIGYPLTMDLRGPAYAPWSLYVEGGDEVFHARPRMHEPGQLVASGYLDAGGTASYTIMVPRDPLLVGRRWSWRAIIGGVRSNLEITTFTDL